MKKFFPSSIRVKLVLLLLSIVIFPVAYLSFIQINEFRTLMNEVKKNEISAIADSLAPSLTTNIQLGLYENNNELLASTLSDSVTIYKVEVVHEGIVINAKQSTRKLSSPLSSFTRALYEPTFGIFVGELRLYYTNERWEKSLEQFYRMINQFLAFVVIVVIVALVILNSFLTPLKKLVLKINALSPHAGENPFEFSHYHDELSVIQNALYESTHNVLKAYQQIQHDNRLLEQKISDRTQMLRRSENRFRQMFADNTIPMILLNEDFIIHKVNRSTSEFYGLKEDELLGKEFNSFAINDVTLNGTLMQKHRLADGSERYVNVYTTLIDSYDERFYVCAIIDVTAKVKFEQELMQRRIELEYLNKELEYLIEKESKARSEHEHFNTILFESASIPLILRDENLKIIRLNHAYENLFGYAFQEICGHESVILNDESLMQLKEIFQEEEIRPLELQATTKNGEKKDVYVISNRVVLSGVTHYLSAITDLTEIRSIMAQQRQQEQLLLQQSKLAAMGEMIGNIAHQWRQPLAQISGIFMNLQMSQELNELTDEYLQQKISQAEKLIAYMSRTIDDFRNFFKPDKEKHPFSMKDVLHEALQIISSTFDYYQINVYHNIHEDIMIEGYPNEFAQVLLIIFSNAKDVFLERHISEPKIHIELAIDETYYHLFICDNAGGIPQEILPKIFDPYFTTKHQSQGTGIGLYMAQMIIQKNMNGRLVATNRDEGACFILSLPKIEEKK